jgi:hypothetical protein
MAWLVPPKDNQSLSSLESSDESVNLAAEEQERTRRSDEIKARLDAKKAERAFMTELIGKSQVAINRRIFKESHNIVSLNNFNKVFHSLKRTIPTKE